MSSIETLLASMAEIPVVGIPEEVGSLYALAWEPHTGAIIEAVVADYHEVTGRAVPTEDDLAALAGQIVTLLHHTPHRVDTAIEAVQGLLTRASEGRMAIRPLDQLGAVWLIDPDDVLDVVPGLDGIPAVRARVDQVRHELPALQPLRRSDFLALPSEGSDLTQIGLVVFSTWRVADTTSAGAIWLLHSYDPEDDVATGYLIMRPEHGVSEHGTVYGRQLHKLGGRIVDPPPFTLQEAIALAGLPYADVLAQFVPLKGE